MLGEAISLCLGLKSKRIEGKREYMKQRARKNEILSRRRYPEGTPRESWCQQLRWGRIWCGKKRRVKPQVRWKEAFPFNWIEVKNFVLCGEEEWDFFIFIFFKEAASDEEIWKSFQPEIMKLLVKVEFQLVMWEANLLTWETCTQVSLCLWVTGVKSWSCWSKSEFISTQYDSSLSTVCFFLSGPVNCNSACLLLCSTVTPKLSNRALSSYRGTTSYG